MKIIWLILSFFNSLLGKNPPPQVVTLPLNASAYHQKALAVFELFITFPSSQLTLNKEDIVAPEGVAFDLVSLKEGKISLIGRTEKLKVAPQIQLANLRFTPQPKTKTKTAEVRVKMQLIYCLPENCLKTSEKIIRQEKKSIKLF